MGRAREVERRTITERPTRVNAGLARGAMCYSNSLMKNGFFEGKGCSVSTSPAVTDLLSGQVSLMFESMPSVLPEHERWNPGDRVGTHQIDG